MQDYIAALQKAGFKGDIDTSLDTRQLFSHDASLFELTPEVVVAPKDEKDLERLVKTAAALKSKIPNLSLTARSAGTCMSGGAIGESVVIDFRRYFTKIFEVTDNSAHVQPGALYRDFEPQTLAHNNALLPCFPASRELASLGGMVSNFSGGEKSLEYGKIDKYVKKLRVILADGKTYEIAPIARNVLADKTRQADFEGQIYKQMFELIEPNYHRLQVAKPKVSKNSTGYNLWDVWDPKTEIFDLTKLFVGGQGTLGLISDIEFKLIHDRPHSGVLVCFMKNKNMERLGELINTVVATHPASFEAFDNHTLILAIKFFPYFHQTLGWKGLLKLAFQLIPDALLLFRGIPKMVLLVEYTGETSEEVKQQVHSMKLALKPYRLEAMEEDSTEAKAFKFRIIRRESFNLLRKKVKDKHTAPFIDDFVVPPPRLTEFLPKLRGIIKKYNLLATIAGHMGDGNFHVIPLMKIEDPAERAKFQPAMQEVNDLVLSYGGSISGEHNDGMIRGPWLERMYGQEVFELFKQTKRIFDPQNIFNPHKKTDADWDFSMSHIREHF